MGIPVPKPKHSRGKPKIKNITRISYETAEFIWIRDNGRCVRCNATSWHLDKYGFFKQIQIAHVENRSQLGPGHPSNLGLLCGPSTNSDTCHYWVDNTRVGKEWFRQWAKENLDENGNYKICEVD